MSQPNDQFTLTPELLGLSDIEIMSIDFRADGKIMIDVKSTKVETKCHKCNGPTEPHGHSRCLTMRHLSLLGREVYIRLTPPRGICKRCDKNPTTTQNLDWFERNAHHTNPYNDYLMLEIIGSTLADVAKKQRLTEAVLQGVLDSYQSGTVDWKMIDRIGLLGVDEIAKKKGQQDYLTIITSRHQGNNKILAVIEGKEKAPIKAFFNSIPVKKKKTITAVCVDMWDNYINAAKEVFDNVPIIIDRFHVAKLYRKDVTALRSQELKRLKKELTPEQYKQLRPAVKILISKHERYTREDKKVLGPLFKLSPAIEAAYRLSREFTHIYNTHHKKSTAKKKIAQWREKVQQSDVSCLDRFSETVSKYNDHICNYFLRRETSGFVEGLNNKIKVIKRRCYGILNPKHFFQRIFLDLQGYDIFLIKQSVMRG